jgi:hypothetical protein
MSATRIEANVRDFYTRLLHLLEFTRDMDRNTFDAEFASRPGRTIHHVFDENVIEFFIGARDQPLSADGMPVFNDKRYYSAHFHQKIWRDRPDDDSREAMWIRINRQLAIVTGEYLFAGALPGQRDGQIYLTEWHWQELMVRLRRLYHHFGQKIASTPVVTTEKSTDDKIKEVRELVRLGTLTAEQLVSRFRGSIERADMQLLLADLDRLRRNGVSSETLVAFAAARLIAAIIESDDLLEPFHQISRLYSRPFVERFRPLHLKWSVAASDRQVLAKAAMDWQDRIRKEEVERKVSRSMRRTSRRIAADAQSLAYVQYVADRLNNNADERIVMVTGDSLIFDAYRRWWSDHSRRSFVMRRVAQYAPLLNFKDANSSVAFNEDIFGNTRRAIEPALLYFNLAEQADGVLNAPASTEAANELSSGRQGAREHFALMLKGGRAWNSDAFNVFAKHIKQGVIAERQSDYLKIRSAWQELERVAIGVNPHLLETRLADDQRTELLSALKAVPDGKGIDTYINKRLEILYSRSASMFVPAAFAAVREWLGAHRLKSFTRRVPIALRLNLPTGEGNTESLRNILRLVDELISIGAAGAGAHEKVYELEKHHWPARRPELLFAVAATMALRLALWDQATFYSSLAVGAETAKEVRDRPDANDRSDYFELLYLRALSHRTRMGGISASDSISEADARALLNLATNDLDACIEYHVSCVKDGRYQVLRALRARSERAAAQLFYVSFTVRRLTSTYAQYELAVEHMLLALGDLKAARHMLDEGHNRASEQDERHKTDEFTKFYTSVRRQIINNFSAWFVFSKILERHDKDAIAGRLALEDSLVSDIREELLIMHRPKVSGDPPAAIAADIHAFFWLHDHDAVARGKLAALRSSAVDLQIDIELVELYKREL